MRLITQETILALATAPLPAGVAILRLSGVYAKTAALKICPSFKNTPSRMMHFAPLVSQDGTHLDDALVVYFENPHSFTGEDVVEFHCHGGKATVQSIIDALLAYNGVDDIKLRHAEAGEFSRRAFANGKMDLTAAEGMADLIDAETEEQRKQALKQLNGSLGQRFDDWRERIMHLVAHVEAAVDFPDEELDILAEAGLKEKIEGLITDLTSAIETNAACRLREGFQIAIIGKPNAGKSTLTNLLTGKSTAIVSDIEGTTRDIIESHLNIGGFPVVLSDTAGIRETEDVIEREGVGRAKGRADEADIVVLLQDAADGEIVDDALSCHANSNNTLFIKTKTDINRMVEFDGLKFVGIMGNKLNYKVDYSDGVMPALALNLTSEESLPLILESLEKMIKAKFSSSQKAAGLTRERHRRAVKEALDHLQRAVFLYENPTPVSMSELLAQDLRDAASAIGRVTGATDTEDILDLVFSTFCIGK